MNAQLAALIVILASLTVLPAGLLAQSTQPAGRFDDVPIRRDAANPRVARANQEAAATPAPPVGLDLGRLAMSLGIVLALIALCAWGYRRISGQAAVPTATSAVRVLGRTALAPRQQILLIQVGRRVIVVGESNGQFAPLSEITDEDEIAALQGEDPSPERRGVFGRLLRRENDALVEPAVSTGLEPDSIEPAPDAMRSEIGSLLQRVRTLSNQFKK